jgi:hypothetical protein
MSRTSSPADQRRDISNALVRAGISLVPGGGAINELLNLVILPSVADRQERWLEAIDFELSKLRDKMKGFSLDDLRSRDDFTSSFIRASRVAVSTHQKEKLEALRNALLNVAIGDAPDENAQAAFISMIDSYTSWHIRFLYLFDDSFACATARGRERIFYELKMGQIISFIHGVFPELRGDREIFDRFIGDLERDHLIIESRVDMAITNDEFRQQRTTNFGRQFLQFISTPEPLRNAD